MSVRVCAFHHVTVAGVVQVSSAYRDRNNHKKSITRVSDRERNPGHSLILAVYEKGHFGTQFLEKTQKVIRIQEWAIWRREKNNRMLLKELLLSTPKVGRSS